MANLTAAVRRTLPYMTILIAIAAIYSGTVMYQRWRSAQDAEDAVRRQRAEQDRKVLDAIGADVRILLFYASPPSIHRGEKTLLCYGVGNAKKVTLDPPIEEVWPSNSRCIDASPKVTTKYTITATDEHGRTATQTTAIEVQ